MSDTAWLILLDAVAALVPAAVYLLAIRRVPSGWPAARTAAFLAAVAVAAVATSVWIDDLATRSLAWHMAQQMALLLVVAPALVAARPIDLLHRVSAGGPWRMPGPAAAWLAFVGVQWVVHLPPMLDALVRYPIARSLMHLVMLTAGLAFFGQITGRRGWVANPLVLSLYILSAMPTTDAIALWLILDPHVIYPVFRGPGALADQHTAGVIMFGAGNILLVVGAAIAGRYLWDGRPGPSAVPTAPR
jgi:cytochrome c oxidase assembly factor CtaG